MPKTDQITIMQQFSDINTNTTLTRVFKFKRNPIGNIKMESTSKI